MQALYELEVRRPGQSARLHQWNWSQLEQYREKIGIIHEGFASTLMSTNPSKNKIETEITVMQSPRITHFMLIVESHKGETIDV